MSSVFLEVQDVLDAPGQAAHDRCRLLGAHEPHLDHLALRLARLQVRLLDVAMAEVDAALRACFVEVFGD